MKRNKVLIVDDEEPIVLGLFRVLYQDNARFDVLAAKTAETAQQILSENEIDVMVTDVRLPGMSGLDLLVWASAESPTTRVIVMTAFDTAGLQERAFRFGCIKLVQKPFDLHQMREAILGALERGSFAGSLSDLAPADVIQMLCLGQKSTALRVGDGEDFGVVHIDHGQIVHAVWNDMVGEQAVFRILQATKGLFNTIPLPSDGPVTIASDWQHLLIEGMRVADEEREGRGRPQTKPGLGAAERSAAKPPPEPEKPEPVLERKSSAPMVRKRATPSAGTPSAKLGDLPAPKTEHQIRIEVARLIDAGFTALRAHDHLTARKSWEQARELDPSNRMVELNLKKLDKMEDR